MEIEYSRDKNDYKPMTPQQIKKASSIVEPFLASLEKRLRESTYKSQGKSIDPNGINVFGCVNSGIFDNSPDDRYIGIWVKYINPKNKLEKILLKDASWMDITVAVANDIDIVHDYFDGKIREFCRKHDLLWDIRYVGLNTLYHKMVGVKNNDYIRKLLDKHLLKSPYELDSFGCEDLDGGIKNFTERKLKNYLRATYMSGLGDKLFDSVWAIYRKDFKDCAARINTLIDSNKNSTVKDYDSIIKELWDGINSYSKKK